jgi:hypothetical protein
MSKPVPTRYRTLNWSSYNAALRRRGSLTVWFDPSTPWHAAPSGKRGAQPVYSDAAIQACLTVKVLFGLPLRQTTGFVASLLKRAGLDWPVPDFSGARAGAGRPWRCNCPIAARAARCTC